SRCRFRFCAPTKPSTLTTTTTPPLQRSEQLTDAPSGRPDSGSPEGTDCGSAFPNAEGHVGSLRRPRHRSCQCSHGQKDSYSAAGLHNHFPCVLLLGMSRARIPISFALSPLFVTPGAGISVLLREFESRFWKALHGANALQSTL